MRRTLIGAAVLALLVTGCGDSSDPDPFGEFSLAKLARSIEGEVDVSNARCHPVRGGGGRHFYCLVDVKGGHEFKLGVVVVHGKERPLITSCEVPGEERARNVMTACALPEAES